MDNLKHIEYNNVETFFLQFQMYDLYLNIITIIPISLFLNMSILIFISLKYEFDILRFLPSSFVYYSMIQAQQFLNLLRIYDSVMSYQASNIKISKLLPKNSFLFLGDSFFTFWTTLHHDFKPYKIYAVNGGFGGATTYNIIQNIEKFKRKNWECVIINIGDNDYFINGSVKGLSRNVETIAKEFNCMVYILKTPQKPSQTVQYINERQNEFEKLGNTKLSNIKICDITHVNIEKKEYFKDGIHIKTTRKKKIAEDIYKQLVFYKYDLQNPNI